MLDKVNLIKSILNKELESKNLSDESIVQISQELDSLIVDYYKSTTGDSPVGNEIQDDEL